MILVAVLFSIRIGVIWSNVSDFNCIGENALNHNSLWPEERHVRIFTSIMEMVLCSFSMLELGFVVHAFVHHKIELNLVNDTLPYMFSRGYADCSLL